MNIHGELCFVRETIPPVRQFRLFVECLETHGFFTSGIGWIDIGFETVLYRFCIGSTTILKQFYIDSEMVLYWFYIDFKIISCWLYIDSITVLYWV